MSFSEKSAWVMLAVLIAVFGPYALELYRAGSLETGYGAGIVGVMIGFVILVAVSHAAIAIIDAKNASAGPDERDRQIALHAERAAGFTLGAWAFGALVVALISGEQKIANIIFLGLATSEIVKALWQIILYRRGG